MHEEVPNPDQQGLLPLMAQFRREYYLVGGTAIALHIGHRRSDDFDMFKESAINHKKPGSNRCRIYFAFKIIRKTYYCARMCYNMIRYQYAHENVNVDTLFPFKRTRKRHEQ